MSVRLPRRDLVGRSRLGIPLALWGLFAALTAVVARWPSLVLDTAVDDLVGSLRTWLDTPGRRGAAGVAARLGAREVLIPVALVAGALLGWRRRSLVPPALLAGSYLLVAGVTGLVKTGLARPQPLPLPGVPGRAFPSGHAAQAAVVFGALVLLLAAERAPEWRRRAIAAAAMVVGLVSVAMLWRQAHWLTDMVGGVTLGLACLTTVASALDDVTRRLPASRSGGRSGPPRSHSLRA
jgi:membrane-associated phospholipid phosphatase